jgi:hypothetical protein
MRFFVILEDAERNSGISSVFALTPEIPEFASESEDDG